MTSHILYQNEDHTIFLVDIPRSLEEAQGSGLTHQVLSSSPPEVPYVVSEPKGVKRDSLLALIPQEQQQRFAAVNKLLLEAIYHVTNGYSAASWCLHRQCGKGRLADETSVMNTFPATYFLLEQARHGPYIGRNDHVPVILSPGCNKISSSCLLDARFIVNASTQTVRLQIDSEDVYLLPPESKFLLSTLADGYKALTTATSMLWATTVFDLILMDPPWENRSVRRAGTYHTIESQANNPFLQSLMVVRNHLAPQGLVAIWQSNKPAVRAEIFRAFQGLDLYLNEEWVWLKTTTRGEPTSQLDGIWKMPFEILLLFRKRPIGTEPKRRIMLAVPDMHSRKPNLRVLLGELLPPHYNAIELFARSLTHGWWSWGDEVLKFQHESCWFPRENAEAILPE